MNEPRRIELDGADLRSLALEAQRAALAKLVSQARRCIYLSEHVEADSAIVFRDACALGVEGIVSKRSPYRSGRTHDWVKCKNPASPAIAKPNKSGGDKAKMFGIMVAIVFGLSSAVATAQTVSDSQTGLAVTPPPGYTAKAAPSRGRYTAVIEVKRDRDRDTGCKVAFQRTAQDIGLSQAQINEVVGSAERRAVIESTLGTLYQVTAIDQVEHAGVRGSVATATLKPFPGLPARASDRSVSFMCLKLRSDAR